VTTFNDPTNIYVGTGTYVRCTSCGLIYLNPRLDAAERREHYEEIYSQDEIDRYLENQSTIATRYYLYLVERYGVKGKLLDMGCGTGFLLKVARRRGWGGVGVEYSENAVRYGRKHYHLDICHGAVMEARFERARFDAVTMINVIEHLPDPLSELQEVRRILKPQGVVLIRTPNFECHANLRSMRQGKQPTAGVTVEHLYYFTRETIQKMLKKVGFEVAKITTFNVRDGEATVKYLKSLQLKRCKGYLLEFIRGTLGHGNRLIVVARGR